MLWKLGENPWLCTWPCSTGSDRYYLLGSRYGHRQGEKVTGLVQITVCSLNLGLGCSNQQPLPKDVLSTPFSKHRAIEGTQLQDVPQCQPTHTSALSSHELIGFFFFFFSFPIATLEEKKKEIPTLLLCFSLLRPSSWSLLIMYIYPQTYLLIETSH